MLTGNVDGKSTSVISHRWIGTCFDESFYRFKVSMARCPVQWCVTVRLRNVAVGPDTEEIAHDLGMSPCCCAKQRGLANGVPPIHVRATLDQMGDLIEVTTPRRLVESRFGATIISGKKSIIQG